MEHLQHFGLQQDPFSNEPDLRYFFESGSHRDAQRRVERSLRQHKGLTLLTGEGGMGKTLLARRILDSLEEEVFEATLLVMLPGAADATGILQRFARQIGCDEPVEDRAGLLGQIYEQLAIVREDGRHAVLMVDDAQVMTPEVFAELGGLLSLEYEDRRLLSMLLIGSPELDEMVQNDASIMPRVDVRVRIQPFDLPNATAYVEHRLTAVQGSADIVPAAAVEMLFKFGRGRPRLLNTLADNALFEAYLGGRTAIEAGDIDRAAADLGVGADPGSTFNPLSTPSTPPAAALAPPAPVAVPDLMEPDEPIVESMVASMAEPVAESMVEPMLEPEPMVVMPEPDVMADSMSMPEPEPMDMADLAGMAEPMVEPMAEPAPVAAPDPEPELEPEPMQLELEPAAEPEAEPVATPDDAFPDPFADLAPAANAAPEAEPLLAVDELDPIAEEGDGSLDFDEPLADFELTPDMETSTGLEAQAVETPTTAVDLVLGTELPEDADADIEGFGNSGSESIEMPNLDLEALEFVTDSESLGEAEPQVESSAAAESMLEAAPVIDADDLLGGDSTEAIEVAPEIDLAEAELSPLGGNDANELDDAFVELLEE